MSDNQNNKPSVKGKTPVALNDAAGGATTTGRVVQELQAAAGVIESGAFDLAGHAHGDTVSELIRISADLQALAAELAHQANR